MSVHGDQKHTTDDNCLITLEPIWSAGLPPLDSNDVGRDLTNTSNQLQLEEHLSVLNSRALCGGASCGQLERVCDAVNEAAMGSPTGGAAVPGVVATAMAQLAIDVARMEKELDTKQKPGDETEEEVGERRKRSERLSEQCRLLTLANGRLRSELSDMRRLLVSQKHLEVRKPTKQSGIEMSLQLTINKLRTYANELGVANSRWAVHCRSLEHEHATQLALERCRADAAKRHAAELVQGGAGTAVELERGGAETAAELGRGGAETAAELGWGGAETAVEPGRGGASGGAETTAELGRGGAETAAELAETQRRLKHAQVELAEAREECRVQTERVTLMGCEQASYRDRIETLQAAVSLLQLELSAVERPRVAAPTAPTAPTARAQICVLPSSGHEAPPLSMEPAAMTVIIQLLQQQVAIFKEDFNREHSDHRRTLAEVDSQQCRLTSVTNDWQAAKDQVHVLTGQLSEARNEKSLLQCHIREKVATLQRVQQELLECQQLTNRLSASHRPADHAYQHLYPGAPPFPSFDNWVCLKCTFHNVTSRTNCELCNATAPHNACCWMQDNQRQTLPELIGRAEHDVCDGPSGVQFVPTAHVGTLPMS